MNPQINQEITLFREFLERENDLGIIIGNHQNLDTYASALALFMALSQAGKKVQIISKKAPTVEVSSLVGVDQVKENFIGNTSKLVVSLPYIKGEVEKVLFTEAPNTINFHLTAAPNKSITPFEIKDVRLNWEGGAPTAIITVGVGTIDELSGTIDQNAKIVNIDNYQNNTRFGDVVLVDDAFSSLSEIVGKILKDLQMPMDMDIAQNILDGVLFATKNFTKPNTSPLAFEAASAAMYQGAQRKADERPSQQPRQQQERQPREQRQRPQQQRVSTSDSQRVNDSDFPAMHMRGQQQQQQSQFENRRQNNPRQQTNDPRMNQQVQDQRQNQPSDRGQQFGGQQFGGQNRQARPQQFGQNPNDVEELMRKIKEENARYQQENKSQNQNDQYPVRDAEIVNEPQMSAPQDDQMPEEAPYQAPAPEEVPDDWLMPKVFKSSKNNN